jgi:hypothetical protein
MAVSSDACCTLASVGKRPREKFCFGENTESVQFEGSVFETQELNHKEQQLFLYEIEVARMAFLERRKDKCPLNQVLVSVSV